VSVTETTAAAGPLWDTAELAEYLSSIGIRVTVAALRVWRNRGTGPRWLKVGHRVYYRREHVREWLRECEHGGQKAS
jgi:hypothetical protein